MNRRPIRPWALVFALCAAMLMPAIGLGLSVNDVARDVRCPTCNTPLDVSNAPIAIRMKQYIADRIQAGVTDKETIIKELVVEFGPEVRTVPPKSGFDLIAWIVPALVVFIGLALIPVITRLWARRGRERERESTPPTPEEARRLQEELDRLEA
jgi:cytochrome c-type biogenesis protein CcmH